MRYPGFTDGTYSGRSLTPAGDRCINLYPESVKSAAPENTAILLGTPGHDLFAGLPTLPVQKDYTEPNTGRVFAIAGQILYEVFVDRTFHSYGLIDGGYYTFASNSQQIMITCAAAKSGWIFTLATSLLEVITSPGFLGAASVRMIDNYFSVRVPNSRQFQICAPLDGLTWDAADTAFSESGPDNLVADMDSHREYWLFGSQRGEVFVDTGAALFPFERINSIAIEQGCAGPEAIAKLDSQIYWLGQNEHGWARVFVANGYIPVGVSDRAVEWWFNQYAKHGGISDAKMFGYQDEDGQSFLVITFPSATLEPSATGGVTTGVVDGAQWVYSVSEKKWHERQALDPQTGKIGRDLATYHTFAFGKHLVGGGDNTGNLYEMSVDVYTSNNNPILRIRRAPHVNEELDKIIYSCFELNAQMGTGPVDDAFNKASLRVSNDGGLTWSNYYEKSLGDAGNYKKKARWKALGSSYRRAFELSTTIKSAVAWVDVYLTARKAK